MSDKSPDLFSMRGITNDCIKLDGEKKTKLMN